MKSPRIATQRVHTGSFAGDLTQRAAQQAVQAIGEVPFLTGRMKSVKFASGISVTVNHGLGTPVGWLIARGNYDGTGNACRIVESATATQTAVDQKNQISLVADANCLVDIWFYPRASMVIPPNSSQSA